MKTLKLSFVAVALTVLAGCTGTQTITTGKGKTCSTDYLLIPAISIPSVINACGEDK